MMSPATARQRTRLPSPHMRLIGRYAFNADARQGQIQSTSFHWVWLGKRLSTTSDLPDSCGPMLRALHPRTWSIVLEQGTYAQFIEGRSLAWMCLSRYLISWLRLST